jgi:hypothetical protein
MPLQELDNCSWRLWKLSDLWTESFGLLLASHKDVKRVNLFREYQAGDRTKYWIEKLGFVRHALKWLLITWYWRQIGQENGNTNRSVRQVGRDRAEAIWQARGILTRDAHTPRRQPQNKAPKITDVPSVLGNAFSLDLKIRPQTQTWCILSRFSFWDIKIFIRIVVHFLPFRFMFR